MTSGEIPMNDGHVFRWMLTGTTVPEICGWVEKDHTMLNQTYGFYRTPDPDEALKRCKASFPEFTCTHNWVEVDAEPPYDTCNSCGQRRD